MPTREDYIEALKRQAAKMTFWRFCLYFDYEFFSSRPFLQMVAEAYQYVYDEYLQGRARCISVSLPPRAGKSYITSLFSAWWLGNLPELSVMRNASTATLYEKLSYDTRKIVRDIRYRSVFPQVRLASDKQNLSGWNLESSKQVGYFGAGVGGQITGFGANLAITDDLYRGIEDALSENTNNKVLQWKAGDHNSRKELNCPEINVGTRWRSNDVIGTEIEKGNVHQVFKIPALVPSDDPAFPQGVSFCEAVNKTEFYLKEKRDIDEGIFEAEYMQEPIELKGLLFPKAELKFYNPATVDLNKLSIFRLGIIDPANEGGDDLAFPVGYLVNDKIYIHDVIYNNEGTDVNEAACVSFIKDHKLNGVRFEGNSAWYLLGQNIRKQLAAAKSNCVFRIITNTESKHTRILAQSAFIRNHFIFRQDWEERKEYRKFMKNLTSYLRVGGAKHDDAPDSCAELAKYFQEHYKNMW